MTGGPRPQPSHQLSITSMHWAATLAARRWIATKAHSHLASPAVSAAATVSEAPFAAAVHKPHSWGTGRTLLLAAGGALTAGSVFFGMQGEVATHVFSSSAQAQKVAALRVNMPGQQATVLLTGSGGVHLGMCCAKLTCGPRGLSEVLLSFSLPDEQP